MSDVNFKKLSLISLGGAVIITGGIIGASAMLRRPSLNINSTKTSKYESVKTVTVKGVAEKEVIADQGAFSVSALLGHYASALCRMSARIGYTS